MARLKQRSSVLLVAMFLVCTNGYNNKVESDIKLINFSNKTIDSEKLQKIDFSRYINAKEINLSNNSIEHIPKDIFAENKFLTKVNLSGNKALVLPGDSVFLESDSIEELNLSGCNLTLLPDDSFIFMSKLKVLDVSNNPIDLRDGSFLMNMYFVLQKIILSQIDKYPNIINICKEYDLTIEIKDEALLKCEDVRNFEYEEECLINTEEFCGIKNLLVPIDRNDIVIKSESVYSDTEIQEEIELKEASNNKTIEDEIQGEGDITNKTEISYDNIEMQEKITIQRAINNNITEDETQTEDIHTIHRMNTKKTIKKSTYWIYIICAICVVLVIALGYIIYKKRNCLQVNRSTNNQSTENDIEGQEMIIIDESKKNKDVP